MEWCSNPDRGLPAPDMVIYLDLSIEKAMLRGEFGAERYEKEEFQRKVQDNFKALMAMGAEEPDATPWHVIDASKTMDEVQAEIKMLALSAVERAKSAHLRKLWV